jgi:hypothetical protein
MVKLDDIRLENIKNVVNGRIKIVGAGKNKCDIIGIYGQNGTGKTAIIDGMEIIQELMTGNSLGLKFFDSLYIGASESVIETGFTVDVGDKKYKAEYKVVIKFNETQTDYFIARESLKCVGIGDGSGEYVKCDFENPDAIISPKKNEERIISRDGRLRRELYARKVVARETRASFIFSKGDEAALTGRNLNEGIFDVIKVLKKYANIDLFVIKNSNSGVISLNQLIPFSFRIENGEARTVKGEAGIRLDGPTLVSIDRYKDINMLLAQLNLVVKCIVPDLQLCIKEYGEQADESGGSRMRFELLTRRGNSYLPLRSESEGIKKIISILSALVSFYNRESATVLIDELDAGIFEYLLGELLSVLDDNARGQLIFTSHNLRPIEVLDRRNIYFTTCNPKNRYIQLKNVKGAVNLRDFYYRSIELGGQRERLYDEADLSGLALALRLAGGYMKYEG